MGHQICHRVYPEKVNKKDVQRKWDVIVQHEDYQEGASGLPALIRWIDEILPDKDAAYEYIKKHDRGWYDQLAVKFRSIDTSKKQKPKSYTALLERKKEKEQKLDELRSRFHFENIKSKFVTCKCCGSRLSVEHLGQLFRKNFCPLCKADLRSETTQRQIQKLESDIRELDQKIKQEEKKLEKKYEKEAKIMWLVKVEYHV